MSASTILSEAYGEDACLYNTVLGVSKDCTPAQLRKAYYKKCLQYHPDKLSSDLSNDEKELSKKKFSAISLAYTILSNEEKRAEYDDSGDLYDDDDDLAANKSGMDQWTDYFNHVFPKVSTADIEAFEVKYKCSDEEEEDVLKYYTQFKGDLTKMLECVMLSSDVDKARWVKDYIEPAIERGDVDDYTPKLQKTMGSAPAKKVKSKGRGKRKIEEEVIGEESGSSESATPMAEVVEEEDDDLFPVEEKKEEDSKPSSNKSTTKKADAKKKSSSAKVSKPTKKKKSASTSSEDALIAQIRGSRQADFDSMMAGLEDRYGGGGKKNRKGGKKKAAAAEDDIDDDEFAKIQAKLMKNK